MDTSPCCWLISLGFLVLLRWPTKPNDEKNEQKDIELRVNRVFFFFFPIKSHRVLGEWNIFNLLELNPTRDYWQMLMDNKETGSFVPAKYFFTFI